MSDPVVTFQEETLDACLTELEAHWKTHYLETQREHETLPLDVYIDVYHGMEAKDMLSIVTMRADGLLVGYFVTFLGMHLKSRHVLVGSVDVYYVAPAYRRQGGARRLFQEAERFLRARGVQRLFADEKPWQPTGTLFPSLGWTPTGMHHTKHLGDA